MVSKSENKLIKSLKQKKYRYKKRLFVIEGKKAITEFLSSHFELYLLFTTEDCFATSPKKIRMIEGHELKQISFLTTPQTGLAIFYIPESKKPEVTGLVLALDGVRDPGNLGTIIRLCDWFGVKQLVCSPDTVDCYNPKVVQATMGSLYRVNISYLDLTEFIKENTKQKNVPVFGAFMEGENIYKMKLPKEGILIMGNEANGISSEIKKTMSNNVSIPQFGEFQETESLNVATATAVLLSEFRRKIFTEK